MEWLWLFLLLVGLVLLLSGVFKAFLDEGKDEPISSVLIWMINLGFVLSVVALVLKVIQTVIRAVTR